MVTIALDAMGGDFGVEQPVKGAAALSLEDVALQVLLVGDAEAIAAALDQVPHDPSRLQIVGSKGCVPMDANPGTALSEMPQCSIIRALDLVASREADAVVSAGHTGATILASAKALKRMEGIRRAALASVYPTERRHGPRRDPFGLMLDVGATLDASPEDLVGFAVMGSAYSSIISEIEAPRVALLSNGTEPNKGTRNIRAAYGHLQATELNFIGNIEGIDIPRGTADVVVCDGFLGNIVLKMLEGVGEVFADLARSASDRKLSWRIGMTMLSGGLREIRKMTDWKAYGGAPLLGMDQVVIKAHGRSEARAIRNACKVAAKSVKGDLIGRIASGMDDARSP